jgi:Cupredoxin-like domain
MQTRLRVATTLGVLGAIIGCGTPQVALLTGDRVTTTTGARSVDALWMMALPPVVVQPVAASDTRRGDARHALGELPDDTVRITLREWKIELSRDQIPPGTVVFRVRNKGTMPHAFEIEREGVGREIRPIRPGADTVIALRLRDGKYEIYCPVGEGTARAHKAMGMLAALNVGSPSAASSSQFQKH